MDPAEVADAFAELHRTGKVQHFGVSNFSPSQVTLLQAALPEGMRLVANQVCKRKKRLGRFVGGVSQ